MVKIELHPEADSEFAYVVETDLVWVLAVGPSRSSRSELRVALCVSGGTGSRVHCQP